MMFSRQLSTSFVRHLLLEYKGKHKKEGDGHMQGAAAKHGTRLHQRIWKTCKTNVLQGQEGLASAHREAQGLAGFLPIQVSTSPMSYALAQLVTFLQLLMAKVLRCRLSPDLWTGRVT